MLLEVIAGFDDLDPRQRNPLTEIYSQSLNQDIQKLRIGTLREGFLLENMEPDVAKKVSEAAERLKKLGAIIEEVSIPEHISAMAIWTPIILEGLQMQMMHGNCHASFASVALRE